VNRIAIYVSCYLMALMEGFDSQIMSLTVPKIAMAWRVPASAFALVFSSAALGMAFGAAAVGFLADRFGRKWSLIVSMFFLGLLTLAITLVTDIRALIGLRLFSGVCMGGTLVNIITIAGDSSPPEHRVRNSMLAYTGASAGPLVASLIGGMLFKLGDWRPIFYLGGAMALACVALPLLFVAGGKPPLSVAVAPGADGRRQRARLFSSTYRARTFALCTTELISLAAVFLLTNWLPTIMARATGSVATASLFTSLIYVGAIVGVVGLSTIVNRVGATRLLGLVFGAAAAVCIVVHFAMGHPDWTLIASLTALGVCIIGGQVTLHTLGGSLYPAELRATGIGVALAVGRAGALGGPIIGGFLLSTPGLHDAVFLVLGGIVAAAACAVLVLGLVTRGAALEVI
jgi:MFS family permease